MFQPHQNLSDRVNGNIIRSEIEGGVYLKDLPDEAALEVVTPQPGIQAGDAARRVRLDLRASRVLPGAGAGAHQRAPTGAGRC